MRLGQISVAFVPDSTGLAYTFLSAPITNTQPPPPQKQTNIYLFFSNMYISKEHSDPAAHHGIIAGDAGF